MTGSRSIMQHFEGNCHTLRIDPGEFLPDDYTEFTELKISNRRNKIILRFVNYHLCRS